MKIDEGEEQVNVCVAIQGMMEDSRIEGSILTCKEIGHSQEEAKNILWRSIKRVPTKQMS